MENLSMQKLKHLIIATIDGISDRIKSTISSTPIKEEVCILYNKKTKQNFVITEEKNIDTLKVYFPVIGLEKFNEKKRAEIWDSDNYVYSGRLDFVKL